MVGGWGDGHAARVQFLPERSAGAQAEQVLAEDPYSGHMFVFRGRRGDLIKIIWWDQQGACLFTKRFERGRFVWPAAKDGKVSLSPSQLSMLDTLKSLPEDTPSKHFRKDVIVSCQLRGSRMRICAGAICGVLL